MAFGLIAPTLLNWLVLAHARWFGTALLADSDGSSPAVSIASWAANRPVLATSAPARLTTTFSPLLYLASHGSTSNSLHGWKELVKCFKPVILFPHNSH